MARSLTTLVLAVLLFVGFFATAQAASSCYTFTRSLTIGSQGADVTVLQNELIKGGYGIRAGATGYFGSQTQTAVAAWQTASGVKPTAGYFGRISQAKYAMTCLVSVDDLRPNEDSLKTVDGKGATDKKAAEINDPAKTVDVKGTTDKEAVKETEINDPAKIYKAQVALLDLDYGHDTDKPDGMIGKRTREMIRQLQGDENTDVTGILSQKLYEWLVKSNPAYESLAVDSSDEEWVFGAVSASRAENEIRDAGEIREAQAALYGLNYGSDTDKPDGMIGKRTREMIRQLQGDNNISVNGVLSQKLYEWLIKPASSVEEWTWGAVSISTDGKYGAVSNKKTREEAVKEAVLKCRSNSSKPDACSFSTLSIVDTGEDDEVYAAAALCENETTLSVTTVSSITYETARKDVLEGGTSDGYTQEQCKVLVVIAADDVGHEISDLSSY